MTDQQPEEDAIVISEDKAKQGRRGLHILMVLIVSAGAAAVVMFLVYAFSAGPLASTTPDPATKADTVSDVDQPTDTVLQTPAGDAGPSAQ